MTTDTMTVVREVELELEVDQAHAAADGVLALTLVDPSGSALPRWTPGAHVDLMLESGLTRQYSLCGDPRDSHRWRVAVLRSDDGRGGSRSIHESLKSGSRLKVRGPRNHFPLVRASSYRFIAGGIGITPLLPMIREVQAAGDEWSLTYCGRNIASMAFVDELLEFGDKVRIAPSDEVGRIDLAEAVGDDDGSLIYCCGPEELLEAVESVVSTRPDRSRSLKVERFAAKAAVDDDGPEDAFEVVLQRSGKTLTVEPGQSVFDVVHEAGVSVLGSCFEGVCGTCETGVISGDVDHRDSILSDEERESNEYMLICVSRCTSGRLTLDL